MSDAPNDSPVDASLTDAAEASTADSGATDGGSEAEADADAAAPDGSMDSGQPAPAHCNGELVIAAINPGSVGGSVAILNTTGVPVAIDATDYALYENPDAVLLRDLEAGVTIAPGAVHRFAYPLVFSDGNASGEMVLYRSSLFTLGSEMVDFVCWGFGHNGPFDTKPLAIAEGLWSGTCGSSIVGVELRRIADTDGSSESSYDKTGTSSLISCP